MSSSELPTGQSLGQDESVNMGTAPTPTQQSTTAKPVEVEDFSDPGEDDLDDLDDMLEEFSAVNVNPRSPANAPPATATKPEPSTGSGAQPSLDDAFSEEEFAKQLQAGMADLLGELDNSPDMQSQFEEIFKQMSAVAAEEDRETPAAAASSNPAPGPPFSSSSKSTPAPGPGAASDASFQDTIRRTMERMQSSGDQATAAAASGGADDFMTEMLKQLTSGGDLGEGNEEDFSKMLMGMMEQLTNKEILYEPMKELDDKFPEWMDKNRAATSAEDLKRYDEQRKLVSEIVKKFEEPTYSDSNAKDREYIVDRMQQMQAAGSPPADLVGDMAAAQDAFNMPGDDQCNPQ